MDALTGQLKITFGGTKIDISGKLKFSNLLKGVIESGELVETSSGRLDHIKCRKLELPSSMCQGTSTSATSCDEELCVEMHFEQLGFHVSTAIDLVLLQDSSQ